ncbi:Nin one binding Zn-ribbon like-domain-containing protein [Gloeopeniophorella convolvens]|nr:Nin one binding Zn-ribbon like-domain-containing protein [Gloeopeniophorella convolvens]
MASSSSSAACRNIVLDAGPLLMLSPLRGLAETYYTVPQVLDELKDKRAREHFEKLGLVAGVNVKVQSPDPASLAHVIQFAKKTGDYSVLSLADLSVIALTYSLERAEKERAVQAPAEQPNPSTGDIPSEAADPKPIDDIAPEELASEEVQEDEIIEEPPESPTEEGGAHDAPEDSEFLERLEVELVPLNGEPGQPGTVPSEAKDTPPSPDADPTPAAPSSFTPPPLYDDPAGDDDGEGEWITPENASAHKARALGLTPSEGRSKKNKAKEVIPVGCMTADFAMQNVLLQLDLSLVGMEGKRIQKVKTWVLRCHACFKICKDSTKKFCPSCGNPTLLRTSVTISSPSASADAPAMQIHLKKNFQYRTRGTIYSIPAPKSGSAKTGSGEGLILREDQTDYMRAMKRAETQRQRDEKKLFSGAIASGGDGKLSIGNWMDPDWIPGIMAPGSGRNRSSKRTDEMPTIGYGKKNPNERRRQK